MWYRFNAPITSECSHVNQIVPPLLKRLGFLLEREEVTLMDFFGRLDIVCEVGTFIFAALTYFNGKK